MHPLSLRQLTLRYTGAIAGMFISLAVIAYFLFYNFAHRQDQENTAQANRTAASRKW